MLIGSLLIKPMLTARRFQTSFPLKTPMPDVKKSSPAPSLPHQRTIEAHPDHARPPSGELWQTDQPSVAAGISQNCLMNLGLSPVCRPAKLRAFFANRLRASVPSNVTTEFDRLS